MRFATLVILSTTLLFSACDRKGPAIDKDYPAQKITDRVYVIHGPNEYPNKANQGFINNPGFVLTKKGVVVIDPGSSLQTGQMVLKKIAAITQNPVIAVFNTHIHGDHWLGNAAIHHAYPRAVIYAHPNMIAQTAEAGPRWVAMLNELTGNAIRGTHPTAPHLGIDHEETLTLGGLRFTAYHTGTAHTDGDLMIEVVDDRVIFLGDNALGRSLRRMDDGSFSGNMQACEAALKTRAEHFVPGHGHSGGREIVIEYRSFLMDLYRSVKRHQARNLNDFEMKDQVITDLKAYQAWVNFNTEIGKLIGLAYLQAEREAF
jgi:glyoxylase-like metal-dependent hydrolase (beta-lactamase superfamily II)